MARKMPNTMRCNVCGAALGLDYLKLRVQLFRTRDLPTPRAAIVSQTYEQLCFNCWDEVKKCFERRTNEAKRREDSEKASRNESSQLGDRRSTGCCQCESQEPNKSQGKDVVESEEEMIERMKRDELRHRPRCDGREDTKGSETWDQIQKQALQKPEARSRRSTRTRERV